MVVDTNDTYALFSPYYAGYAQDTWRVNRNLTLTLGLRVEYERGATERYNRALSYFDPTLELPISAAAEAAYARNPIPELPASAVRRARRAGLCRTQRHAARALAKRADVAAPRLGGLATRHENHRPRRLRHLLRHAQRDEFGRRPVRLLARHQHAAHQRCRHHLARGRSQERHLAARRSLPGPRRRHSLRRSAPGRARLHGSRRPGLHLRSLRSAASARAALARRRPAGARRQHAGRGVLLGAIRRPAVRDHAPRCPARAVLEHDQYAQQRDRHQPESAGDRIRSTSATSNRCGPPIRRSTSTCPRWRSSPARRSRRIGCCARSRT